MFRHCVMFKWAEGVADDTKARICSGLDELAKLDCVAAYLHGADAGLSDGNWDYGVVGDFASIEDYQTYATNGTHLALIADFIKPNISGRAAMQFHC